MKALEIDYTMSLEFSVPVIDHYFVLRCVPISRGEQTVTSRSLVIDPNVTIKTGRDAFGNVTYRGLLQEPHKNFGFNMKAQVQVNNVDGSREDCLPLYRYPSSLTDVTNPMKDFLRSTFMGTELEYEVINKCISRDHIFSFADILCSSLNSYMNYISGSTTVKTKASESFSLRKGVCQDFSHIYCALCRESGVSARYVCGVSVGEGATHAWVEFFVPDKGYDKNIIKQGRWYGIDPTRNKRCDNDYVVLACGRDYNDCQVDRGIFRGNANQKQKVFVRTREIDLPDYKAPKDYISPHVVYSPSKAHDQTQQ